MGSPITFSGFNSIDFTVVLNAIITQESRPLQALQARERTIRATDGTLAQLITKLDTLRAAAQGLSKPSSFLSYRALVSDEAVLTATAGVSTVPGRYDIKINALARAQVTVADGTVGDPDEAIVSDGGTLIVDGVPIGVGGPLTLRQLASRINSTPNLDVTATIVETAPRAYRLVLTSDSSGAANAFTVLNTMTSSVFGFTAPNAVEASDAWVSVNNIPVASRTNTLTSGVPGATITLKQEDPTRSVIVTVGRDDDDLIGRVEAFVAAHNDVVKFADQQSAAAIKGTAGNLGRDSLVRGLRNTLRTVLTAAYGEGQVRKLAEIGIGFNRVGQLVLNKAAFKETLQNDPVSVKTFFADPDAGVFTRAADLIGQYTKADGFISNTRTRLNGELSRLSRRMDDMQARLAVRRAALQREFIAADEAMSRLNNQSGSLSNLMRSLTQNKL